MKNFTVILYLIALSLVLFSSCEDEIIDRRIYTANVPIYMSNADFKAGLKIKEPQDLVNPGKIYFKDSYIFINEMYKGIHVFDNSDPSDPQNISFIELPSNLDIAIADNFLYADSYTDLVVIDISDIHNPIEIYRIDSAFPYSIPPYDTNYPLTDIDESKGVVIGFEIQEITEEITVTEMELRDRGIFFFDALGFTEMSKSNITNGSGTSIGIAGSMSKFMIYDHYLYTLFLSQMKLFDISTLNQPLESNDISIAWDIETLFRYEDKMFIGAQTGMYIYDLSSPGNPTYISEFTHAQSCDPVVVEDDIAYVTLRSGTRCGGILNQLDVLDVSDVTNPIHLKSYSFYNPHGLGIDNGTLFICDGESGLKIFDAQDPLSISDNQIAHFESINSKDVIPLGDILLMIGNEGLYQYDYTDLSNLKLLSIIPVTEQ
ncbi:MAG: hypothetical protein KOO66_09650 [Bacteroidales bacterium]|nr:hypothetical protein [Bacteroidales bacterium]